MQLNRLSHLVFPQPASSPVAEKSMSAGLAKDHAAPDAAGLAGPGVLYTGSAAQTSDAPAQEPADIASLSLEEIIALGKSKGVFNHITYTRNGTFGPSPARTPELPAADFVSSAVSIMRDFQEGMATLKTESPAQSPARSTLWESGFKSFRQAVGRLNATA